MLDGLATIQQETQNMNAKQQIKDLLKTVYDAGDVNAMEIWKGYSYQTQETGWHYKWFGRSEHHFLGKSVAEAKEHVAEIAETRQ
jgi:hypothetical protein